MSGEKSFREWLYCTNRLSFDQCRWNYADVQIRVRSKMRSIRKHTMKSEGCPPEDWKGLLYLPTCPWICNKRKISMSFQLTSVIKTHKESKALSPAKPPLSIDAIRLLLRSLCKCKAFYCNVWWSQCSQTHRPVNALSPSKSPLSIDVIRLLSRYLRKCKVIKCNVQWSQCIVTHSSVKALSPAKSPLSIDAMRLLLRTLF